MSRKFILTPEAVAGALDIWKFIADEASEKMADRVIARIYDECDKLAESPGIGHYRDELLDRRHRFWSVWSNLIVYRWQTKPLQIIAIVHGSRDLEEFFRTQAE
jgi:plasmid stabilization system protein ParE